MANLRLPFLALLAACTLTSACMRPVFPEDSLPKASERPVYGTFNASYSTVWDAGLQVMSDRYPIAKVDKEGGLIVTEWVIGTSDYIFTTFAGTKIPEKIRYKIHMEVKNRGNRVEVRLLNEEEVEKDIISANLEFTGAIYEWLPVPTSTRKEREILQQVLDIIEGRSRSKSSEDID